VLQRRAPPQNGNRRVWHSLLAGRDISSPVPPMKMATTARIVRTIFVIRWVGPPMLLPPMMEEAAEEERCTRCYTGGILLRREV